jgi:hypothetical protein
MNDNAFSKELFQNIDLNNDGLIDFDEFLYGVMNITQGKEVTKSKLIKLFFQVFGIKSEKAEYSFTSLYSELKGKFGKNHNFPPQFTILMRKKFQESNGTKSEETYSELS